LVNRVRVVAVYVRLLHKRKVYSVIEFAERCNSGIVTRLLAAKLLDIAKFYSSEIVAGAAQTNLVAWETENDEVTFLVFVVQSLEA
jgi:hypothetical protein